MMACPVCKEGELSVVKIESVETAESEMLHDHSDWEPDWIGGGFHGVLKCNRGDCDERMVVSGDYRVQYVEVPGEKGHVVPTEQYRLRFSRPAFVLLEAPETTPDDVVEAVANRRQAFMAGSELFGQWVAASGRVVTDEEANPADIH